MPVLDEIKNYLLNEPIEIPLYPDGGIYKCNTIDQLKEYIEVESDFLRKYKIGDITQNNRFFTNIKIIINRIEEYNDFKNQKDTIDTLRTNIKDKNICSSRSNLLVFITQVWDNDQSIINGIYDYYFNIARDEKKSGYFKGQLLGFYYKDANKFKEINKTIINENVKALYNKYNALYNKVQVDYEREVENVKERLTNHIEDSDKWFKDKTDSYNKYVNEKNEILAGLEKLYQEKLRLEAPATYWNIFRKKYQHSGIIWIALCGLVGSLIAIACLYLLNNLPDQLFIGDRISVENTIKWTILLALLFSTGFYLFRLFMKLGLSSFHLSRDANERLQLTYQYLSLLKENAVDEKHKEIIMQSLFSRADTGLLKGDSGPTMPDSLINQILKNISK